MTVLNSFRAGSYEATYRVRDELGGSSRTKTCRYLQSGYRKASEISDQDK